MKTIQVNVEFQNSGSGLYKDAFNIGLHLFIIYPYLPFSAFPELPGRFLLVSGSMLNILRLNRINRNRLAGIG